MGILASAFALLLLQGTVNAPIPEEYQGPARVEVMFVPPGDAEWYCLDGRHDDEVYIYACYKPDQDIIIMPNPCAYPEAKTVGSFAHLMCHEKAHPLGWKH